METHLRIHEAFCLVSSLLSLVLEPAVKEGCGITIWHGRPIYDPHLQKPLNETTELLMDLLAEEALKEGLPSTPEDAIAAVVTYDRGGIRRTLAETLARKIGGLQRFPCEPFIVAHNKGAGGVRGRLVLDREGLRDLRRRKAKVYFLTDLLETESYLIRMAKTARQPRHGLRIVRFSAVVKRDRGIRRVILDRVGEELPLVYFLDCQLDPRQSAEDGDAVQHEIDRAFEPATL